MLFVHEGSTPADHEEGLRVAAGVLRFLAGGTPAQRIYDAAQAQDFDALAQLLDPNTFVYNLDDGSDPTGMLCGR